MFRGEGDEPNTPDEFIESMGDWLSPCPCFRNKGDQDPTLAPGHEPSPTLSLGKKEGYGDAPILSTLTCEGAQSLR